MKSIHNIQLPTPDMSCIFVSYVFNKGRREMTYVLVIRMLVSAYSSSHQHLVQINTNHKRIPKQSTFTGNRSCRVGMRCRYSQSEPRQHVPFAK